MRTKATYQGLLTQPEFNVALFRINSNLKKGDTLSAQTIAIAYAILVDGEETRRVVERFEVTNAWINKVLRRFVDAHENKPDETQSWVRVTVKVPAHVEHEIRAIQQRERDKLQTKK